MHQVTNKFIMDAASNRSPILMEHTLHIHVKESNNSLLKINNNNNNNNLFLTHYIKKSQCSHRIKMRKTITKPI